MPFPRPRPSTLVLAATAAALLAPHSASALTFGAALDQLPANNDPSTTCANRPVGSLPVPTVPVGSQSCQFSYMGAAPDSLAVPISGTVTTVRVKVGNVTGPMRVNVMRMLFQQTGMTAHPQVSGPFHQTFGPTFTPQPNAITTVAVNLPVVAEPTPHISDLTTISAMDMLALEVLSPNVPAPIFPHPGFVASYPIYPGPSTIPPQPAGLPSFGTGVRFGVMMNADITAPGVSGGPTPLPGPLPTGVEGIAAGPTPTLALRSPSARVRGNRAALPLICSVVDCTGRVTLERPAARGARAETLGTVTAASTSRATEQRANTKKDAKKKTKKKKKKKKATSLGRNSFKVKAGRRATVRVGLNSRGRALMRGKKVAKVEAVIRYDNGTETRYKISLRR